MAVMRLACKHVIGTDLTRLPGPSTREWDRAA